MREPDLPKPSIKSLGSARRKPINASAASLLKTEYLRPDMPLPLVVTPAVEGIHFGTWAGSNREWIGTELSKHGGILFRNFKVETAADLEQFVEAVAGELLDYSYRSTPRNHVEGKIYTSTEYPASQAIPLHNEMAYSRHWPMKIAFHCVKPAERGGETPIADSRKVFQRIAPAIREEFMRKKVMYVRNYGDDLDLPWQNVFQTNSRSEVEDYCRRTGIEFEWKDGDRLRTRQLCQAVATHPQTGEMVWFNQAHLFHISGLDPAAVEALLDKFREEDLPRNSYYGDSSPIDPQALAEIREAYQQEAVIFPWQRGDVLLLDNMLAAHGRTPYAGPRQVRVGMAEPMTSTGL